VLILLDGPGDGAENVVQRSPGDLAVVGDGDGMGACGKPPLQSDMASPLADDSVTQGFKPTDELPP
jgi:hypothetical protein